MHLVYFSAATSLIQTTEREADTDWTLPLVFSYQSIFIKNPTSVYNYTAYLEPLTYLSWGIIFLFLIMIPVPLYLVAAYSREKDSLSIGESFGAVYVALLLLGSLNDPGQMSTRIVFFRY